MKWVRRVILAASGFFILGFSFLWIASDGAGGKMSNQVSINISRPPDEVFPWLVEPEKLKQWVDGLVESQPLTEEGIVVGARSREIVELGGERLEIETEIISMEANRSLVVQLDSQVFAADARYHLQPEADGTLLRYSLDSRYRPFLLRLILPLIESSAKKTERDNLERLKRAVENEPAGGTS